MAGGGAAGKFQDHYKLLGVDPKATVEQIKPIYERLSLMYSEKGSDPNPEQFEAVKLAWEVLIDPVSRELFDAVRGGGSDDKPIQFSGISFFEDMQDDSYRREVLLCVLYDVRRQTPRTPTITYRQLSGMLNMSEKDIGLAMWYLKTRGLILVDDKSKFQITANGMDYLQTNPPTPHKVMQYIKNVEQSDLDRWEKQAGMTKAEIAADDANTAAIAAAASAPEVEEPVLDAPLPEPEPAPAETLVMIEPKPAESIAVEPVIKPRPIQILRRPAASV